MKGHYLMLVLPDGKEAVKRFYLQLDREDETLEEAVERYVRNSTAGRKRNVATAQERVRKNILSARITRPTSWHMARYEAMGLDAQAGERPTGKTIRRRGR